MVLCAMQAEQPGVQMHCVNTHWGQEFTHTDCKNLHVGGLRVLGVFSLGRGLVRLLCLQSPGSF